MSVVNVYVSSFIGGKHKCVFLSPLAPFSAFAHNHGRNTGMIVSVRLSVCKFHFAKLLLRLLKLYVGVYIKSRHMNYLSAGYSLYLCNVMRSLLETRCKVSFIGKNFSQQTFLYRRGGFRCGPMLFFLRHVSMCVCVYICTHLYVYSMHK